MTIILMGVSGSGKSTLGKILAKKLNGFFIEGDELHPKKNIQKMSNGIPLNDNDRYCWLKKIKNKILSFSENKQLIVVSCSALKEKYREIIQGEKEFFWIFLFSKYKLIYNRIKKRKNHFMSEKLLKSQFEDLEIPSYGLHINVKYKIDTIIEKIIFNIKND
ncbi:MAG: gluconate kinase [Flavobacteriaceae bacterium]|nr:gluconate kinase [Flavobacteriaceae bacterium]